MKYTHFCHVDPQEPNITLVGLFIIQRLLYNYTFYYTKSASVLVVDT